MKEKNAPASRAISKAMRVRRYDAERIDQYGRSRATLDATEHCNQASICPVSPQRMQSWSSILAEKSSCGVVEITFRSWRSKITKRTLYSAHQSNKLCRKVERHDESGRTQLPF